MLFVRVPYYNGDLNRDPNSENYPLNPKPEYRELPHMGLGLHGEQESFGSGLKRNWGSQISV